VNQQHTFVFNGSCDYDIIFGQDFLRKIGMKQDFDSGVMTAFNITVEMKHKSFYSNPLQALSSFTDDNTTQDDCFHSTQKPILESKYDKADIEEDISEQKHLNQQQKTELQALFEKQEKLFLGKLGLYPFKKMNIELIPTGACQTIPCSSQPTRHFQKGAQMTSRTRSLNKSGRNQMGFSYIHYT
jgi:hypothetical protein